MNIKGLLFVGMLSALCAGCAVVPYSVATAPASVQQLPTYVDGHYVGMQPTQEQRIYAVPAPVYAAPAPVYVGPPLYFGFGFNYRSGGGGRHHHRH